MGGAGAESEPLFPDGMEWWRESLAKNGGGGGAGSGGAGSGNNDANYGSALPVLPPSPIADDDGGGDAKEEGETSFLIDRDEFPEFEEGAGGSGWRGAGGRRVDVQSEITSGNGSSSSIDSDDEDDGSGYETSSGYEYSSGDYDDEDEDEDEIEPPHRTIGLVFFDCLRFVAISANARCINTELVPVFLAWGRMELLFVALRIFVTLFSLLLILVEFPELLPFLRHDSPGRSASFPQTTIPPLSIINWIPRGAFYVFLSVICFEQSIVLRALDEAKHASTSSRFFDSIFIVISAWCMLAVGAAYIVLGLFCIQKVMERVRRDEREKWARYYEEVKSIEAEREEAEEREWLLENGGEDGEGGEDPLTVCGRFRKCWRGCRRWWWRVGRRRAGRRGGVCRWLGCRAVDWRC